jgi:hypothetical protein
VSTKRTADILVTNDFDNPANITLTHRSGDDPDETTTWTDVGFGESGDEPLTVHYETGPFSSFDYWHVRVDVVAGPNQGTWENSAWKECYLKAEDQGRTHHFSVSAEGGLKLNMVSSSCTDGLTRTPAQ